MKNTLNWLWSRSPCGECPSKSGQYVYTFTRGYGENCPTMRSVCVRFRPCRWGLGFDHGDGRCASPFPPVLVEMAMKRSLPVLSKRHLPAVLDVTAGGPIRGTMVSMFGAKYIGVELSKEQVAANILTGQRTSSKFGEAPYYQKYPRFKV
jgi:hypothetical protein